MKTPEGTKSKKGSQCERFQCRRREAFLLLGHHPDIAWAATGKWGPSGWQEDHLGKGCWSLDQLTSFYEAFQSWDCLGKGSCSQNISPSSKQNAGPCQAWEYMFVLYFQNIIRREKQALKKKEIMIIDNMRATALGPPLPALPKFLFLTMWLPKRKQQELSMKCSGVSCDIFPLRKRPSASSLCIKRKTFHLNYLDWFSKLHFFSRRRFYKTKQIEYQKNHLLSFVKRCMHSLPRVVTAWYRGQAIPLSIHCIHFN